MIITKGYQEQCLCQYKIQKAMYKTRGRVKMIQFETGVNRGGGGDCQGEKELSFEYLRLTLNHKLIEKSMLVHFTKKRKSSVRKFTF